MKLPVLLLLAVTLLCLCLVQGFIFNLVNPARILPGYLIEALTFLPTYYLHRDILSISLVFFGIAGVSFSLLCSLIESPLPSPCEPQAPSFFPVDTSKRVSLGYRTILFILVIIGLRFEISLLPAPPIRLRILQQLEIWLIALASIAFFFALVDRFLHRPLRNPLERKEWFFVLILTGIAAALYSCDLSSYRYAFIGDEFLYYSVARRIVEGTLTWDNVFSLKGAWDFDPRLCTLYQAAVMKIFGTSNFGWRFSSVLASVACIMPFYIFLRLNLSREGAVWGSLFFTFSHYVIAFAHGGTNQNQVLFPTILAFCLFSLAGKSGSYLGYYLSGFAAGLGFCTLLSGRLVVIFVLLMFVCSFSKKRWRNYISCLLCFAVGFIMIAAPILFSMEGEGNKMFHKTLFYNESAHIDDPHLTLKQLDLNLDQRMQIKRNVLYALAIPVYSDFHSHFVRGTFFDALTSSFFVLGIFYAMLRIHRRRIYLSMVVVYIFSELVLGITTPYPTLAATRMLLVIPPACFFSALGVERFFAVIKKGIRLHQAAICFLMTAVAAAMICMNLHRVYIEAPRLRTHYISAVLKYIQENPHPDKTYYLCPDQWKIQLIKDHLSIYGVDKNVEVYNFKDIRANPKKISIPCRLVLPGDPADERGEMVNALQRAYPAAELKRFPGPARGQYIYVIFMNR